MSEWTTAKPTDDGVYWLRAGDGYVTVVEVETEINKPGMYGTWVYRPDNRPPMRLEDVDGSAEWFGPIKPPSHPRGVWGRWDV